MNEAKIYEVCHKVINKFFGGDYTLYELWDDMRFDNITLSEAETAAHALDYAFSGGTVYFKSGCSNTKVIDELSDMTPYRIAENLKPIVDKMDKERREKSVALKELYKAVDKLTELGCEVNIDIK